MTDFLSYLRLILTILRKCILAPEFQSAIAAFFKFLKRRYFKGVCENTRSVRIGASRTEAC